MYIQGACHFAEENTEAWREGTPGVLPHHGAGGSWPHQLVHRPITSREEPSALTACPWPSSWKPCPGDPRMEWSTPSILPAHPPNPPNSPVMYKTFPETAYSSCIFHEARPKLKLINIKISRSTLKKKKKDMFHKTPGDPSQGSPSPQGYCPGLPLTSPLHSPAFSSSLHTVPFLPSFILHPNQDTEHSQHPRELLQSHSPPQGQPLF